MKPITGKFTNAKSVGQTINNMSANTHKAVVVKTTEEKLKGFIDYSKKSRKTKTVLGINPTGQTAIYTYKTKEAEGKPSVEREYQCLVADIVYKDGTIDKATHLRELPWGFTRKLSFATFVKVV